MSAQGGPPSEPHGSTAGSPASSVAGRALHHLDQSPEPDGRSEDGRAGDFDRDELDDEADEAASTSTGRGRSPEPPSSAVPPPAGAATASTSEASSSRVIPQAPGTKTQAAFVHKLWSMLETPSLSHLISWTEDGKSFIVHHPAEFARVVLPQYFKHSNFSSFIRQNFYSFSKVSDFPSSSKPHLTNADGSNVQTWEFRNPHFQRDRPELLSRIKRKTAKSNNNPSPSSVKRRSSVTTLTSLRPGRRDSVTSADEREREQERPMVAGLAGAAMAAGGLTRPAREDAPHQPPSDFAPPTKRVAAGLADFAPYPSDEGRRGHDEPVHPVSAPRSPSAYSRHAAPHPPAPPSFASTANPAYSPGTRAYHIPPASSYPGLRHPYGDDALARQVHSLEAQVRSLGDALYHTQHELAAQRSSTFGIMHSLLSVVASMDSEGRRKDELEACAFALSKLSPEASPTQFGYGPFVAPHYGGPGMPSWSSYPFPMGTLHSPRPSTSTSQQFYYNRVPAVESYTRASRPDVSLPADGPTRPPSRSADGAYAPPSANHDHPSKAALSHSASAPLPPPSRPSSSQAAATHSHAHSYPSPRLSWAGGASGGPNAPGAAEASNGRTTTLPPLSSLLNPTGPPPPFGSSTGHGRTLEGVQEEDERARKKLRQ
ncbi:hypothetical protein JCM10207_002763 [Rhodosporidiobolus poonsookiae]